MKGNNNGSKYKPKPIKRYDHTGALVNYGTLEVGIVAGIRCLGNKETLLLIGAGLAKQKVPDYFYTQHHVRVPLSNGSALKVYAIKATDVSSLASRISGRVELKKAMLVKAHTNHLEETWVDGSKTQTVAMEAIQFKTKAKRVTKLRKLWLLVKRLFSNQEVKS